MLYTFDVFILALYLLSHGYALLKYTYKHHADCRTPLSLSHHDIDKEKILKKKHNASTKRAVLTGNNKWTMDMLLPIHCRPVSHKKETQQKNIIFHGLVSSINIGCDLWCFFSPQKSRGINRSNITAVDLVTLFTLTAPALCALLSTLINIVLREAVKNVLAEFVR